MATPFPNRGFLPFANPVSDWVDPRRNALMGFSAGMLSGNPGGAMTGAMQGSMLDQQYARDQMEFEQEQEAKNATVEWLQSQGYDDLVQMAQATGDIGAAWSEGLKRSQPAGSNLTADMQNYLFAQENPGFADFIGGGQKPTSSMQEYQFAVSQGYDGTFQQYETDMKRAGATNIDFNANQGTAAAYADRMAAANAILDDPKLTAAQTDAGQAALSGVPLAGNFLTSEERKMAEQAQRDFINAILRRESGAVISPSEFENAAKQYFPQPGDTPAVIEQKKRNREMALQGVARAAGPNYQQPSLMSGNGWTVIGVE